MGMAIPGPQSLEQYEQSHMTWAMTSCAPNYVAPTKDEWEAMMQRQRAYEGLFAEEYGKDSNDLSASERCSSAVMDAHKRAMARLDNA